jgi:endonuclease YncB( thermonuclease family)
VHVKETVRLARINAPEMNSLAGQQARAFLVMQFAEVQEITISTKRQEKYGRWLAEVSIQTPVSGQTWINLNDLMLSSNHAVPYYQKP